MDILRENFKMLLFLQKVVGSIGLLRRNPEKWL
jgi:hypothetical protein